MDKREKAKTIAGIVFKSLWILISLGLWIFGITVFIDYINSEAGVLGWFVWGLICTPAILGSVFGTAVGTTRSGWRSGANTYSATVDSNSVTVENHPFRGAITGFIGGLLAGVAMGPITLTFKTIRNIRDLIDMIRYLNG